MFRNKKASLNLDKWKVFKTEALSLSTWCLDCLLPVFVFLIPTQLGLHFWPDWSLIFGIRIDYLAPTLFLSDILIVVIVTLLLTKLVLGWGREQKQKLTRDFNLPTLLIVVLLAIFNIVFSRSWLVTLLFWLRIGELGLLSIYLIYFNQLKAIRWLYTPLAASIIFFGFLGFIQFYTGRTLGGLFYYLGERTFSASSSGIALVELFGRQYLRSYATFSHPNSLAGYFGLSLLMIFTGSIFNKFLKYFILIICGFLMIFTFSKATFFALTFILFVYGLKRNNAPFFKKAIKNLVFAFFLVNLLAPILISKINVLDYYPESISYRLFSIKMSGKLFAGYPIFGVGLNNFIGGMTSLTPAYKEIWFLQPVHNVYLLLLAEMGLVGVVVVFLLGNKLIGHILSNQNIFPILPLLFILVTACFDHYWLTLNQNRLLLTIWIADLLKKNEYTY